MRIRKSSLDKQSNDKISNGTQNCYCNASKPFNRGTLECQKCHRLFHDECIQCLTERVILGDNFFLFVCALCNSGSEHLSRIELTWTDVIFLLLYNLSDKEKKKYHTVEDLIRYFETVKSNLFLYGEVAECKIEEYDKRFHNTLNHCHRLFQNAKETRKSKQMWGLREDSLPNKPPVVTMKKTDSTKDIRWKSVQGRKIHVLCHSREYLKHRPSRKRALDAKSAIFNTIAKTSRSHNTAKQAAPNTKKVNSSKKTLKPPLQNDKELTGVFGLLDNLIPQPPNFEKYNNPFRKNAKKYKVNPSSHSNDRPPDKTVTKISLPLLPPNPVTPENCVSVGKQSKIDIKQYLYNNIKPLLVNGKCKRPKEASRMKTRGHYDEDMDKYDFSIVGRRITEKKVQYLVQWNW